MNRNNFAALEELNEDKQSSTDNGDAKQKKICDLEVEELADLLNSLNFSKLSNILKENNISGAKLNGIKSAADLQKIDNRVKALEAKGWFKEITKLKETGISSVSEKASAIVSLNCPICKSHYSMVDPTTLPCGHCVCINDAKDLKQCPDCSRSIPGGTVFAANFIVRNIARDAVSASSSSTLAAPAEGEAKIDEAAKNVNDGDDDDDDDSDDDSGQVVIKKGKKKAKRKNNKKKPKKPTSSANNSNSSATDDPWFTATTSGTSSATTTAATAPFVLPTSVFVNVPDLLSTDDIAIAYQQASYYYNEDAFKKLEALAKTGSNPYAVCFLDLLYLDQRSFNVSMEENSTLVEESLVKLKRIAAQRTDKHAMFIVARYEKERDGSVRIASEYFNLGAEMGYSLAIGEVAVNLWTGFGCPRDRRKALEMFRQAAALGHHLSTLVLGLLQSESGDEFAALENYKLAASHGIVVAYTMWADVLYSKGGAANIREGDRLAKFAADKGYSQACGQMAMKEDRAGNHAAKMEWLKKAARKGDIQCTELVLQEFLDGMRRGPINFMQDVDIFMNGFKMKLGLAHLAYGTLNEMIGMHSTAIQHYATAGRLGDSRGNLKWALCIERGNGCPQDYAKAMRMYQVEADKGNPRAMFQIGEFYEFGKGVTINLNKALQLYVAALRGEPNNAHIAEGVRRVRSKM